MEAAVLRTELAAGLVTPTHAPQITVLSTSAEQLSVGVHSAAGESTATTATTQLTSYDPFELLGASDNDDDDESDTEGVLFLDIWVWKWAYEYNVIPFLNHNSFLFE